MERTKSIAAISLKALDTAPAGISITVIDKINAAIEEAEGRARARCITCEQIIEDLWRVTQECRVKGKAFKGFTICRDINAQKFPNKYKGIPESTHYKAHFDGMKWRIDKIYRDRTRTHKMVWYDITEEAHWKIIEKVMDC